MNTYVSVIHEKLQVLSSASSALKQKTLMLQVWKFSYVWLRYLLLLNKK